MFFVHKLMLLYKMNYLTTTDKNNSQKDMIPTRDNDDISLKKKTIIMMIKILLQVNLFKFYIVNKHELMN